MEIASPLYDVVFKFLLEELGMARLFFSALIGVELVNLEPMPQELAVEASGSMRMLGSEKRLSIYRLDYAARALDKTGKTYLLLAEIQREKIQLQAMRFRKYLGKQYLNSHHSVLVRAPNGRYIDAGIPILPIYILGQCLPGFEKVPVMGVKSVLEDRQSARQLPGTNHFIESLFHKGLIVQTPALPAWGSTELEGLLSIFSPQNQTSNPHIMQIDEATFPQKYRSILRRLQMAAQDKKVRDSMSVEDEFIAEMQGYEDRLLEAIVQREEAQRKQAEAQRKQAEALRKQEEAQRKQEEERVAKERAIRLLIDLGVSREEIASQLGLSREELEGM